MTRAEILQAIRPYFDAQELVCDHTFAKWGGAVVAIPGHGLPSLPAGDPAGHPQGAHVVQRER